ncbi:MAG: glycosyltransferase family 2 protein [Dinoroseobacter sp.]|nr:glycosyltransferase family 2 protein [Dinoroseobacter sp.]
MTAETLNNTWAADPEFAPGAVDPADILVVLPALNEASHIEACLRSLMRPERWMSQCRIVVADGGSDDGTQRIVERLRHRYPNLHLLDNPGRLQSAGVNAAVEELSEPHHKLLVRCDVHAVYPDGYVMALAREYARVKVASVVTSMDATGQGGFQKAAAWIVDTPLGSGGSAHRGGQKAQFVDHGHHAAFDIAWFQRVGGYDPAFSHNEDAEFDMRLVKSGGKIWLTDQTRISYIMRPTLSALWRQYSNYGHGRASTLRKHHTRPRLRQLVPVLNTLLLLASLPAMFFTPFGLIWPVLYGGVLLSTSLVAVLLLRSMEGLWAGPALGAMHTAWGLGFLRRSLSVSELRTAHAQTG